MKNKSTWLVFPLFLFVCGGFILLGQERPTFPRQRRPPIFQQKCPDILVASFNATLIGTQVGDSSADFPHDMVRLEAVLTNGGSLPLPAEAKLHIEFKRNGQTFTWVDPVGVLSGPGSRWTIARTDRFPHNTPTTYSVAVTTAVAECQKENNQATFQISEAELHPGGTPDLTCSIFKVEKRWLQQGSGFKGSCLFAAKVSNVGKGSVRNDSQPLQLFFFQNKERLLTKVVIPESDLPAPGYDRVFSVETPDSDVPYGEYAVYATIEQAHNETNRNNNWSTNTGLLKNSAEAPVGNMARISFPQWGMLGQILYVRVDISNLEQQPWSNLRLILYKNDAVLKEWKGVALGPGAKIQKTTTDDRPDQEPGAGDAYKAVLATDDSSGATPPAGAVLDAQTRRLAWIEMAESLLQSSLRDETTGIGPKMEASDHSLSIYDDKTNCSIKPESIFIEVKGNKRIKGGAKVDFTARVWLKPHVRNGKIAAEVVAKQLSIDSEWVSALLNILLPGIGQAIVNSLEKHFASSIPDDMGLQLGGLTPCGIVLKSGFLYLYY